MEKAEIKILNGVKGGDSIVARFNPSEVSIRNQPQYEHSKSSGEDQQELQYKNRKADELSVELYFDTSEELEDVRDKYTKRIAYLTRVDPDCGEPASVQFLWGSGFAFKSKVTSVDTTITMFMPDGTPVRARSSVTFERIEPPDLSGGGSGSGGGGGSHTLKEGETLEFVAAQKMSSPSQWQKIAKESGISNPRDVEPGTTLTIPSE